MHGKRTKSLQKRRKIMTMETKAVFGYSRKDRRSPKMGIVQCGACRTLDKSSSLKEGNSKRGTVLLGNETERRR